MVSCQRNQDPATNTLSEMCERLFPQHAHSFQFQLLTDSVDIDRFTLESDNGKILIRGNNRNSLAVGLNHYLKYYCQAHVSWYASDSVVMPAQLPEVEAPVILRSKCKNRFFLNYCTFGYSMPYWKWSDWERLIDWMALNGVTMPLAITGQESIWYKVWTEMGLSDEEVRTYFTGPAHLPWHRMSNVDYWQSPLPQSWLADQEKLQKLILERERAFDMTPILPAFAGHVPAELKELYPEAKIYTMSQWGGYDEKYRSHFIDPMDSLYSVIQRRFLEEQTKVYGTNHIYGIDPFNEVDSPNWNEEFLSNVSDKIYKSIQGVDSAAQWLQMTWMFYHAKEKWTQPRIKSFLNAVPQDKLILLDYYCDYTEIWRDTEQYYGKPYIWCYLGNFGGNTFLAGDLNDVDFKIPPKYQGGEINTARTNYHYNDLNTFGILCVDDYLPSSYGCWYNFKGKNLTIGSHDVAYFHEYNNFAKHNVSHAYFSSGDSIYCISWGSGEMTDEMEEIIINTPDSSYDTATFYGILNEAKQDYEKEMVKEYSYYAPAPSKERNNYFIFWRY